MSEKGAIHVLDSMPAEGTEWLYEIAQEMGGADAQQAYRALRGTLFALRARLPVAEAAQFAGQLPPTLRSLFYDGFRSIGKPQTTSRSEFFDHVCDELGTSDETEAARAFSAVLRVLERRLADEPLQHVRDLMPKHIRAIWKQAA